MSSPPAFFRRKVAWKFLDDPVLVSRPFRGWLYWFRAPITSSCILLIVSKPKVHVPAATTNAANAPACVSRLRVRCWRAGSRAMPLAQRGRSASSGVGRVCSTGPTGFAPSQRAGFSTSVIDEAVILGMVCPSGLHSEAAQWPAGTRYRPRGGDWLLHPAQPHPRPDMDRITVKSSRTLRAAKRPPSFTPQ